MLWYFEELVRIFRESSVPKQMFLELEQAWMDLKSRT